VIALRGAAERSPIEHGLNGLVADNAKEFADHVIKLWNDRTLCRQMGKAARATIAAEYSREDLVRNLGRLIYG
jgi:glycosyltransferase involved in cell wall biosynthesis